MQPDPKDFDEWLGHPVTEWVFGLCQKRADDMQALWAAQVWETGEIKPEALLEARVRADCYLALPQSSFEDWSAIDGSEAE